ncbi:MAG: hypothetical protein MUF01_18410, partial [Bryobacterales bacterium]|nr:hypothetical protein [Bryobacterales bacterium]
PRRSLLDALAEYENEAAVLDEAPDPLTVPETATAKATVTAAALDTIIPAGDALIEAVPDTVEAIVAEVASEEVDAPAALAIEDAAAEPEDDESAEIAVESVLPRHDEILSHAAAAVAAQGEVRRLAIGASGVRLDPEEIRAAVEIAVSASMSSIVDEVTRYVTMALEARYRQANEAPADKASD